MDRFRKFLISLSVLIATYLPSTAFANFLVVTHEQISATPEGLFVKINEVPIAVESLSMANDGYFVAIPVPSPFAAICPNCAHDTYIPGRTCSNCGFPLWDGRKKTT